MKTNWFMKAKHWLGWCYHGHCPAAGHLLPDDPIWKWLRFRGWRITTCDCGRRYCQGWKVNQ